VKNTLFKHKSIRERFKKDEKSVTASTASVASENKENSVENVNTFVPSNVIQPIKKCIHLKKMVKLKALKHKLNNVKKIIICEDCEKDKTSFRDIYICLTCAKILCGPHDGNHVENHQKTTGHCIYGHITSRTFYCFSCQDDILYGYNNNSTLVDVKKAIDKYEDRIRLKEMIEIRKEKNLETIRKASVYPGLKNLKHTCFFNSVMQCLVYTKPLEDIVDDKLEIEEGPLTNAFVAFLKTMHGKLRENEEKQKNGEQIVVESFTPNELFNEIIAKWDQYKDYNQQDGHELLRHLLDGIRDEQLQALKEKGEDKKQTFIDELFEGRLINYIVCDTCKLIKHNYEPFFDLSLSISDEVSFMKKIKKDNKKIGPDKSNIEKKLYGEKYPLAENEKNQRDFQLILQDISIEKAEKEEFSIQDCLKKFMDIDTLEGKEACICDNCTKIRYGGDDDDDDEVEEDKKEKDNKDKEKEETKSKSKSKSNSNSKSKSNSKSNKNSNKNSNKKSKTISNKKNEQTKNNRNKEENHFSEDIDEDYTTISYYSNLSGITEDKKDLKHYQKNKEEENDSEEEIINIDDDDDDDEEGEVIFLDEEEEEDDEEMDEDDDEEEDDDDDDENNEDEEEEDDDDNDNDDKMDEDIDEEKEKEKKEKKKVKEVKTINKVIKGKGKKDKKQVVYRRIKKRSFIDEAPKILVINLKRFVNNNLYGHVRKSEIFVDFQPYLKLEPYLSPIRQDQENQPFYRLYGVVVHSGINIQSGHYFAYISRSIDNWFYASDVIIKPSSWDEVKNCRPYLLFYERIK
jgi:ubiquitin C-terminal hydrolase